ncbi:MAG: hypothetical protein HYW27_04645 [Candidatus Aenigmarchaeota archaeon]|nr:hypothetical protein [Candidatus Aenigmarchaeota archaeon]
MTIRIILDSNIYGLIIDDHLENQIIEKTNIHKNQLIFYGMKEIRKELRASPKHSGDNYNLRFALLHLYDSVTKNHSIEVKPLAKNMALLYYQEYRRNKGALSWREMMPDLLIVAQATLSQIDIVTSHDNRSMMSEAAKKAYYSVNKEHNMITPNFIGYGEFKRKLF